MTWQSVEVAYFDIKMTQLGDVRYLLGVEIDYVPGKRPTFSQCRFTQESIVKFGNINMNPSLVPQTHGAEKSCDLKASKPQTKLDKAAHPYRNLVGALQYLVTGSRIELGNAVRTLSKYLNCYTSEHWAMAMRVVRYLVGTLDFGLVYNIEEARTYDGLSIESWADSDWANDTKDCKSITGYVMKLNGQTISAKSSKHDTVGTSSSHTETIAASTAARDVMWLEQLLEECSLLHTNSTMLMDSHGAISLCQRPGSHKRSKHIMVRHLVCREYVEKNGLSIRAVQSAQNQADLFTKAVTIPKFLEFRSAIGIVDVKES